MAELLALNGPNLNLLGRREPQHYDTTRLEDINNRLAQLAQAAGHRLQAYQSNAEHALIERVHQAMDENVAFILLNPGAFTHTSIALRDALAAARIPFVEIHLSNIYAREAFRRQSYFSDLAAGVISGLGAQGYELALQAALQQLQKR